MGLTDQEAIEAFCHSTSAQLTVSPLFQNTFDSTCFSPDLPSTTCSPSSDAVRSEAPCSSISFPNRTSLPQSSTFSPQRRRVLSFPSILSSKEKQYQNGQRNRPTPEMSRILPSTSVQPPATIQSPIASAVDPTSSTRSISCFELVGTLGCGSYGKVLLGRLAGCPFGRLSAIKVLRKTDMKPEGIEEVKRELRTLRWIKGQTSCGVNFLQTMTESFQNGRFVFMILEYHPVSLANTEVASRLRLKGPSTMSLSLPSNLEDLGGQHNALISLRLLAAELVLGLCFLHDNGIVHQDLKPANIMVSSSGHVVISDFGSSTFLPFSFDFEDFSADFLDSKPKKVFHSIVLPSNALVSLTPLYAAPEIRQRDPVGHVIYDHSIDWWSLGVTLYELATGTIPFFICSSSGVRERLWRRTEGDFSLAFGELQKIVLSKGCIYHDDDTSHLEGFLRALLTDKPHDRLGDEDVKTHSFFDPFSGLWDDIAAMAYPPLPNPPSTVLDPSISLNMSVDISTALDANITLPRLAEEMLPATEMTDLLEPDGPAVMRFTSPSISNIPDIDQLLDEECPSGIHQDLTINTETEEAQAGMEVYDDEFESLESAGCHVLEPPEDGRSCFSLIPFDDTVSDLQPFPSTASLHYGHLRGNSDSKPVESHDELNPAVETSEGGIGLELNPEIDEVLYMSSLRSGRSLTSSHNVSQPAAEGVSFASHISLGTHLSEVGEACIFSPRPPLESLVLTRAQSQRRYAGLTIPRDHSPGISSSSSSPTSPVPTSSRSQNVSNGPSQGSNTSKGSKARHVWTRFSTPQASSPLPQRSSKFFLPNPKRLSFTTKSKSLLLSSGRKEKRLSAPARIVSPAVASPEYPVVASPSPLSSNLTFDTSAYACMKVPYYAHSSILQPTVGDVVNSPDTQQTLSPQTVGYPRYELHRVRCRTPGQRFSTFDGLDRDISQSGSVRFPLIVPLPSPTGDKLTVPDQQPTLPQSQIIRPNSWFGSPHLPLPNPYSPQPGNGPEQNWQLVRELPERVTLEERLTIEVLNAMDTRDRHMDGNWAGRARSMSTSGYDTGKSGSKSISLVEGRSAYPGIGPIMDRRATSMGAAMEFGYRRRNAMLESNSSPGVTEAGLQVPEQPSRTRRRSSLLGLGLGLGSAKRQSSRSLSNKGSFRSPKPVQLPPYVSLQVGEEHRGNLSPEDARNSQNRRTSRLGLSLRRPSATKSNTGTSGQHQNLNSPVLLQNPMHTGGPHLGISGSFPSWEKVGSDERPMGKVPSSFPPTRRPFGRIWEKLKKMPKIVG